jgi:hypothetical protein
MQNQKRYYRVKVMRLTPLGNLKNPSQDASMMLDGEAIPEEPIQVEVTDVKARILSLDDKWFLPEKHFETLRSLEPKK